MYFYRWVVVTFLTVVVLPSVYSVDTCLQEYEQVIELNYTKGSSTSFTFDLCSVIKCWSNDPDYRTQAVYICGLGWPGNSWCPHWDHIWQSSSPKLLHFAVYTWQIIRPEPPHTAKKEVVDHFRIQRDFSISSNPITVSITNLTQSPYPHKPNGGCWDTDPNIFYLVLGLDCIGNPSGLLKINLQDKTEASTKNPTDQSTGPLLKTVDYTTLDPKEVIALATGYSDDNLWLTWMSRTAREQSEGDCVACASGRPQLTTYPAPLLPNDAKGFGCMLNLTKGWDDGCETLGAVFPPINNETVVGPFLPSKVNGTYTCFNFTNSGNQQTSRRSYVGEIDTSWCADIRPGSELGPWARAGLYYFCGGQILQVRITSSQNGLCAMVRLRTPLILLGERLKQMESKQPHHKSIQLTQRRRRHILRRREVSFSLETNNPTYIDAIGVPRGVPNEYKLVDQVAAGFENLPIVSAIFPVTPSKNVDRLNYVWYNILRLTNLTRDAVGGLSEQLAPTSLMAVQNRMALDMLLAEKGGVCFMFGDMCCTFIPNNTAPDGSVARALDGLRTLSKNMHEHSGLDNPLDEWFNNVFGKWKTLIMSVLTSVAIFTAILVTCGCCCVPCIRSLMVRFITTTIEDRSFPSPHMMPLLPAGDKDGLDVYIELQDCADI